MDAMRKQMWLDFDQKADTDFARETRVMAAGAMADWHEERGELFAASILRAWIRVYEASRTSGFWAWTTSLDTDARASCLVSASPGICLYQIDHADFKENTTAGWHAQFDIRTATWNVPHPPTAEKDTVLCLAETVFLSFNRRLCRSRQKGRPSILLRLPQEVSHERS